jgi:predicted enzyme related to lactoylglutathione lyase
MGKRESYEPGTFCWVDLTTPDAEGAKAFYGDLLGWQFSNEEIPGGVYTVRNGRGDAVAAIDQQDGYPAHWNNYVCVTSADQTASRAKRLGARVIEEPSDVAGFCRLAVFADPGGAVLCVWEPRAHIGAGRVNDVGCMSWNELQTRDSEAAGDFYGGLFGWEIEPIEDEGKLLYTTIKNAGSQNGGFMPMTEQHGDAPSFWIPYFTVSSRDAAMEKAHDLGGIVLAGPLDLPAGKIAILGDPQGAAFAVFEGETDE